MISLDVTRTLIASALARAIAESDPDYFKQDEHGRVRANHDDMTWGSVELRTDQIAARFIAILKDSQ